MTEFTWWMALAWWFSGMAGCAAWELLASRYLRKEPPP
jgi:hypothetical protein